MDTDGCVISAEVIAPCEEVCIETSGGARGEDVRTGSMTKAREDEGTLDNPEVVVVLDKFFADIDGRLLNDGRL